MDLAEIIEHRSALTKAIEDEFSGMPAKLNFKIYYDWTRRTWRTAAWFDLGAKRDPQSRAPELLPDKPPGPMKKQAAKQRDRIIAYIEEHGPATISQMMAAGISKHALKYTFYQTSYFEGFYPNGKRGGEKYWRLSQGEHDET